MKIYALRDKLLNYYLTPFAGNKDQEVLAGIAQAVNNIEENNAIAKAPHHFEIWCLGTVTESGHIEVDKYLVADANSLIRENIREKPITRTNPLEYAPEGSHKPPDRPSPERGTQAAPPTSAP